jgi:hypothetical protein
MKMKVTYEDETVVLYKVKPRHLIAFEDEFGEFKETVRSSYGLAHLASESPLTMEQWLESVDDIEPESPSNVGVAVEGEVAGEPVPTV